VTDLQTDFIHGCHAVLGFFEPSTISTASVIAERFESPWNHSKSFGTDEIAFSPSEIFLMLSFLDERLFEDYDSHKIPGELTIPYRSHHNTKSTTESNPTKKSFLNFVFTKAKIVCRAPDSSHFLFWTRLYNKDDTNGRKCNASQKSSDSTILV